VGWVGRICCGIGWDWGDIWAMMYCDIYETRECTHTHIHTHTHTPINLAATYSKQSKHAKQEPLSAHPRLAPRNYLYSALRA